VFSWPDLAGFGRFWPDMAGFSLGDFFVVLFGNAKSRAPTIIGTTKFPSTAVPVTKLPGWVEW
jgi:hypothetical protein